MPFAIYTPSFQDYARWDLTYAISEMVAGILTRHAGIPEAPPFLIIRRPQGPMCSNPPRPLDLSDSQESLYPAGILNYPRRIIFLNTEGIRWCQWVYQLAHELCHHLIGGTMTGDFRGCQWFEEALCETASLFCLAKLADPKVWRLLDCPRYALSVQEYLDSHLQSSFPLREAYYQLNQEEHRPGIRPWLYILEQSSTQGITDPQRTLCNGVASLLLPAFLRMPRLWRIIGLIGDSKSLPSIEALSDLLNSKAPDGLLPGLKEIEDILLPR